MITHNRLFKLKELKSIKFSFMTFAMYTTTFIVANFKSFISIYRYFMA